MSEEPPKSTIRLELTKRQKQRIREATGRGVNRLGLRLEARPEPEEPRSPVADGSRTRDQGDDDTSRRER